MKEEVYIVRNLTKDDIGLGELRTKVLAGKTVDLIKMAPWITMEKIEKEKDNGTLGVRLRQKRLVEIKPDKIKIQERMKIINNPTVFEEKVEKIVFPNKLQKGIVMKEKKEILEEEILTDDDFKPAQIEPKKADKNVIMEREEGEEEKLEENISSPRMIEEDGVVSSIPDEDFNDELKLIEKAISAKVEDEAKMEYGNAEMVAGGGAVAVVPKNDEEEEEARPVKIKKNMRAGETETITKGGSVEVVAEGGMITLVDKEAEEQVEEVESASLSFKSNDKMTVVGAVPSDEYEWEKEVVEKKVSSEKAVELTRDKCKATNRFGKPCQGKPQKGSDYCYVHRAQNK